MSSTGIVPVMPRLAVRDLTMQFPAVLALDGVSLEFFPGEVHGVIGENGAGKSTLMKILAGLQRPTSGHVEIDGSSEASLTGVRQALARGIAMIHQELNLVDELTVAENIFLGREPRKRGVIDRKSMRVESQKRLDEVGAKFGPDDPVKSLSIAEKQLVEIAKALSYDASTLIMDEPTAVLSEPEAEALFALIFRLKESGVSVIYISHRLAEVEAICDRISVLRDGKWVKTLMRNEANQTEFASLMVGRPVEDMYPPKKLLTEDSGVLEVVNASDGQRVADASLRVIVGEIVGVAGLVGSGRTELAELIFGIRRAVRGSFILDGGAFWSKSPSEAMQRGIAYVSEDRKDIGLHLSLNTIENTTLANLRAFAKPLLNKSSERDTTQDWIKRLDIRVGDAHAPIRFLSGGNQQKVSLAKWLDAQPKLLIVDEPTRGVDVGAKAEIYALIASLAAQGMACLVISSEMQELIGLCHRIVVMREGRTVGELSGSEMTEHAIMHLAAGVEAA